MVKKLKDITLEEVVSICESQKGCGKCALYKYCPKLRYDLPYYMKSDLEKGVIIDETK